MFKLVQKAQPGQSFDINNLHTKIGRDDSNDIVLSEDGVSGFHVNLVFENGKVDVIDLGSTNGTRINGKQVSGRQRLEPWQELDVGGVKFELVDPQGRRPTQLHAAVSKTEARPVARTQVRTAAPPGASLLLKRGPRGCPERIEIGGGLTVGRSPTNDVTIDSDMVSGRHAKLQLDGDELRVVDMGSTNGTRVNGRKVSNETLSDGDTVAFDEVEYTVEMSRGGAKTRVNPAQRPPTSRSDTRVSTSTDRVESKPAPTKAYETPVDQTPAEASTVPQNSNADDRFGLLWLLLSPSGRLPRLPYFVTNVCLYLFYFLISLIGFAAAGMAMSTANLPHVIASLGMVMILYAVGALASIYISAVVFIKRVHDMDWSGWLVLITFLVPLIFFIFNPATIGPLVLALYMIIGIPYLAFLLVVLFKRGTEGPNRYGNVRTRVL